MRRASVLITFLLFAVVLRAQGAEQLGSLTLGDLFLEPEVAYQERSTGEFRVGRALIAANWILDPMVSAHIAFGTENLINKPVRYGMSLVENLTLVEAYGQAETVFGRLRLGIVPVPFGTEGGRPEHELYLPRSLLFSQRFIGLRDYGLSYSVKNAGFFSEWVVHNGEGGRDLDNKTWLTARWGWSGSRGLNLGFSGSTGRTTPDSTNPAGTSSSAVAGLNVDELSRVRLGNFFLDWRHRPLSVALDLTVGETVQMSQKFELFAGHLDLLYRLSRWVSLLARYDEVDPNKGVSGDKISEAVLGFAFSRVYDTSVFFVLGSKVMVEGSNPDYHQVRVAWRLTPNTGSR